MSRQNSLESEQILRTERSSRLVDKERMITLLDSSILQEDCHFVEEFFNFEPRRINNEQSQRSGTEEKRETSRFNELTFTGTLTVPFQPS